MRTERDLHSEVKLAVLDRTDRSIEMTIELAVKAGIEFERERIKSILELSVPAGLEKALVALALAPTTTVDQAANFIRTFPLNSDYHNTLRKSFRLIESAIANPTEKEAS